MRRCRTARACADIFRSRVGCPWLRTYLVVVRPAQGDGKLSRREIISVLKLQGALSSRQQSMWAGIFGAADEDGTAFLEWEEFYALGTPHPALALTLTLTLSLQTDAERATPGVPRGVCAGLEHPELIGIMRDFASARVTPSSKRRTGITNDGLWPAQPELA
jgi:hypothetical protein